MINLRISARKFEVDAELTAYIERKLGRLDRFFPRRHQPTGMALEIERVEAAAPDKRYAISVQLEVPGPDIHAKTATMNPHSAIDVIEAKLKAQITEYKEKHAPKRLSLKRLLPAPPVDEP